MCSCPAGKPRQGQVPTVDQDRREYDTPSMRRAKASLNDKATVNLRAIHTLVAMPMLRTPRAIPVSTTLTL